MWVGPVQAPNLVPQHQVVLEQAQGGSLAHGPPYQPFPPPVPRASPEQLLSEIRQALPGYELSRLVAIEATQRVLSKHLSEMAAMDEKMGGLFAERAEMQKKMPHRAFKVNPIVYDKQHFGARAYTTCQYSSSNSLTVAGS